MIVDRPDEQRLPTIVTWTSRASGVVVRASWFLPLVLVFATEYKFRRRTNEDALAGQVDPFILLELGIYAMVGLYLLVRLRPRLRPHPILVWTAGYCLSCAVAAIYSPYLTMAMVRGLQMVIVLLTVLRFVDDGDLSTMRRFLHGYIVLVTVSILVGMAFVMPTTRAQQGRFTWLSVHSVVAGAMLAMSVVILFGMWLTHRAARLPWARWVYGLLLAFHLVAILRTETRGSIGAALVAVVIMALLWLRSEGKRDLLIGSVVAVVAIALAFGPMIIAYVLRDNDVAELATFNRRTEIWTLAWDSFLTHPLQGRGFTAARGVFFEQTKLGGAHNAYINVVVDLGLVGLFWWVGLIGLIIAAVARLRRRSQRMWWASSVRFDAITIIGIMICQLINGLTAEWLGNGISVGAVMLFITGAWVIFATDAVDSVDIDRPDDTWR
jgi:exopolysaccharide production protein ExoQ